MGLITAPSLRTRFIDNTPHNAVSFTYDWSTDTPRSQNLGGVIFQGSSYRFNVTTLNNPAATNLPILKSLQFSQSFTGVDDSGNTVDGSLYVYVPSAGQFIRLAQPTEVSPSTNVKILTGIIPLLSNTPTEIIFAKGVDGGGMLHGIFNATLFDDYLPSYITSGISPTP